MWSQEWIPYVLTSISGLGIVANLSSYRFIRTTFNINDNLFNILAKDSLITALCTILQFTTDLLMMAAPGLLRNELGCLLNHYGGLLATFIGPAVTVLISSRRFTQIKYPLLIKINSKAFNAFTSIALLLVALYHLIFSTIDMYLNLQQYSYYGLCLGNLDEWSIQRDKRISTFLLFFPNLALMLIAICLDFFIKNEVKKSAASLLNKTEEERRRLEKIPKRAAFINASVMFIWVSFHFVDRVILHKDEDKLAYHRLLGFSLNAFRNLISARFAFQINEEIKRDNVEDRRKWEIEHAMKERDERRRKLGLIHQVQPVQDISVL